jgi:hypothetical protein
MGDRSLSVVVLGVKVSILRVFENGVLRKIFGAQREE